MGKGKGKVIPYYATLIYTLYKYKNIRVVTTGQLKRTFKLAWATINTTLEIMQKEGLVKRVGRGVYEFNFQKDPLEVLELLLKYKWSK